MILTPITFAGFLRDESDNIITTGVYYQPWFRHVNGGSSASTWYTGVQQTGSDGYYSFNLGDSNFLTVNGNVGNGDEVLIAVWTGDNVRASLNKVALSFRVVVVSGSSHINDLVLLANRPPVTVFTLPASNPRQTDITGVNGCNDNTVVGTMSQAGSYASQSVFPAVSIAHSTLVIDTIPQTPVMGMSNHVFQLGQGTHSLEYTAVDSMGLAGNEITRSIDITFRTPVGGFTWDPPVPTIIDTVDIAPTQTDIDGRVYETDWYVDSVAVQTGYPPSALLQWQFDTGGPHTVRQALRWNDGYVNRILNFDRVITVGNINPSVGFNRSALFIMSELITFTSTATDPDGTIVQYGWLIEKQDGAAWVFESQNPDGTAIFSYAFSETGTYRMTHTVHDNSGGSSSVVQQFTVTTTIPSQSMGGYPRNRGINMGGI